MNRDLGEVVLNAYPEMKVDVHKPQIMLHVEVRNMVNIYSEMIPGPGGMPVGTNGKAMLLLSGGIDSPVAGYPCQDRGRRGCEELCRFPRIGGCPGCHEVDH